jgi:DNA-binding transcriptional LysR family regulator
MQSDVCWDDYRLLLATSRKLSFQAAAQELGVATSTVSRRVAALEQRTRSQLFERVPHGVRPTAAGRMLAAVAQSLEAELARGEHQLTNLDTGLSGPVKLTAGDGFGEPLVPMVAEFKRRYPQIEVELAIDTRVFDLARGEADLALRMPKPRGPGLRARKLATLRFGLYASQVYLTRRGVPRTVADLKQHDLIGRASDGGNMAPSGLLDRLGIERFAVRVNNPVLVRTAVLAHLGIGVLVTGTHDLVRVLPALESAPLELWLARHESTRGVRRVDTLAEFLAERVRQVAG